MKGPLGRTKVVLRRLPPTISQSSLIEHVGSRFSGRYHWLAFRPGKTSQNQLTYSRAYIDFDRPDDVVEFAEFFSGHVFVNEKGTQYKMIVEYAPSQRVPKQLSKNDGREGTIYKDPEYMEFLEYLAKPIENLPSAEIQLERREAERSGSKDIPIVTPLIEFVRQKRAAKGGSRKMNGKATRRVGEMSSRSQVSRSSRRGLGKRATMYVLRDSSKDASSKEATHMLVSKQDDQELMNQSARLVATSDADGLERGSGGSGSSEIGSKKILLLKGKEKEISNVFGGSSLQQNAATPGKNTLISNSLKQNQQREYSRRIRSIPHDKDSSQHQSSAVLHTEQRINSSNETGNSKPPRASSVRSFQKNTGGTPEIKDIIHTEKQERKTRNKDRPDRGVWAPLRRSDGSHASNESLSSTISVTTQVVDSIEDSYRHGGRRGSACNVKNIDGSSVSERTFSKRGGSSGTGSHEKQMWIQKSSPGP